MARVLLLGDKVEDLRRLGRLLPLPGIAVRSSANALAGDASGWIGQRRLLANVIARRQQLDRGYSHRIGTGAVLDNRNRRRRRHDRRPARRRLVSDGRSGRNGRSGSGFRGASRLTRLDFVLLAIVADGRRRVLGRQVLDDYVNLVPRYAN